MIVKKLSFNLMMAVGWLKQIFQPSPTGVWKPVQVVGLHWKDQTGSFCTWKGHLAVDPSSHLPW